MELARLEKVHDMPKRHDAVEIWSAVNGHTGSDVLNVGGNRPAGGRSG